MRRHARRERFDPQVFAESIALPLGDRAPRVVAILSSRWVHRVVGGWLGAVRGSRPFVRERRRRLARLGEIRHLSTHSSWALICERSVIAPHAHQAPGEIRPVHTARYKNQSIRRRKVAKCNQLQTIALVVPTIALLAHSSVPSVSRSVVQGNSTSPDTTHVRDCRGSRTRRTRNTERGFTGSSSGATSQLATTSTP